MFDDWKFHLRFDLAIPPGRLPLMWCLIAFLLTFLVTRTIVRYIRHNAGSDTPPKWWQPRNIGHGTTHIHHVVIGVILVMISGVTMVTLAVDGGVPEFTAAAIFFGIGAALVLDEFALILHLQDVYWSEDGRTSVDAVFAAIAVAGLLILGFNPLSFFDIDIWRADHTLLARATVIGIALVTLLLAVDRAAQGQGVDRSGGDVRHTAAHHRRVPVVAAACAMGAVALCRPPEEDAPGAGTRAPAPSPRRAGQAVAATRHRR